jgi:hypothetical protein
MVILMFLIMVLQVAVEEQVQQVQMHRIMELVRQVVLEKVLLLEHLAAAVAVFM